MDWTVRGTASGTLASSPGFSNFGPKHPSGRRGNRHPRSGRTRARDCRSQVPLRIDTRRGSFGDCGQRAPPPAMLERGSKGALGPGSPPRQVRPFAHESVRRLRSSTWGALRAGRCRHGPMFGIRSHPAARTGKFRPTAAARPKKPVTGPLRRMRHRPETRVFGKEGLGRPPLSPRPFRRGPARARTMRAQGRPISGGCLVGFWRFSTGGRT